ncbi:BgTH12-02440 [Blumeria graminis f. sp. triticale]|uniref:Bgt-5151 n=3 Tax=Blumeria graminis TaxID=34373 RepID=A0A061HEC9_BLUGR|nr:hypothetical protein BGT96224_5151 [Blumeria graminis f. sp. tritici 96224]CAD6502201.1 BgTH12-02440 [Blumeria graminis f. sp. triticale]VDB86238.1 Bgt-5151 [Blumeria graminis f. sp. tritici]
MENIELGVQYPDGVIKKTWVRGRTRDGDDIKIEEVLQKDDITLAVLGAFQVDGDWVRAKLNENTRVYWVLQAKTKFERDEITSRAPSNHRICFPSMTGNINCMHSKLQLIAHPSHLRIVVATANLVSYDWGETGVMENMCFLIDLPRLGPDHKVSMDKLTNFGQELSRYLEALGLPNVVISSIRNFDFSRTSRLGFVHSIGGQHVGTEWKNTGFCGLAKTVQGLGLQNSGPLQIDFLTASMGKIDSKFITYLQLAARGDLKLIEDFFSGGNLDNSAQERLDKIEAELTNSCRIYYPTSETVSNSVGGVKSGGTICFNARWWQAQGFLHGLLRDCESQRKGVLMHSKMWFVHPEEGQPWVYVGSANLTESAWGRLVKDARAKGPKMNSSNWECGIIYPVSRQSNLSIQMNKAMDAFSGNVPVPMVVPGTAYGDRQPWMIL